MLACGAHIIGGETSGLGALAAWGACALGPGGRSTFTAGSAGSLVCLLAHAHRLGLSRADAARADAWNGLVEARAVRGALAGHSDGCAQNGNGCAHWVVHQWAAAEVRLGVPLDVVSAWAGLGGLGALAGRNARVEVGDVDRDLGLGQAGVGAWVDLDGLLADGVVVRGALAAADACIRSAGVGNLSASAASLAHVVVGLAVIAGHCGLSGWALAVRWAKAGRGTLDTGASGMAWAEVGLAAATDRGKEGWTQAWLGVACAKVDNWLLDARGQTVVIVCLSVLSADRLLGLAGAVGARARLQQLPCRDAILGLGCHVRDCNTEGG